MFSKLDLIQAVSTTGGTMRVHASDYLRFYTDAWAAFDAWISDVFTDGRTARIPRFALLGWEIMGTGTIGGGAHKPYFVLNISTDPYAGFDDRSRVSTEFEDFDPLKVAMKYSRLLNKDLMASAVEDLLKQFRHTCRAGTDMSIEFQVGRFVSRGGSAQFYFDSGLCGRVAKSVGFALFGSGAGRPPSSFPSTAKRLFTSSSSGALNTAHLPPVSPVSGGATTVPRLPLSRSGSFTAAGGALTSSSLHTKRTPIDPLRSRKLVADAAYQRFLESVKKQQLLEVKSQQQYDLEVMEFDCDMMRSFGDKEVAKVTLKETLQAQMNEARARQRQEEELARAPVDLMSGSVLPTLDMRKYAKYNDSALPSTFDVSRLGPVDAAVFRAGYFTELEAKAAHHALKQELDAQVQQRKELERKRIEDEKAVERRIAADIAAKEASDFRAKEEARSLKGAELKASWDRDMELQRLVAQKQEEMVKRSQRWKADMTRNMVKSFHETGSLDLRGLSVPL